MKSPNDSPDQDRISELLKLKRCERPDPGFWQRFDHDLQRRLIQQAVIRPTVGERLWLVYRGLVHAAPVTACAMIITGLFIGPAFQTVRQDGPTPAHVAVEGLSETDPAAVSGLEAGDQIALAAPEPVAVTSEPAPGAELGFDSDSREIPARLEMRAVYRGNFTFVSETLDNLASSVPASAVINY
ncbi:MAG: hypothetical protein ACFB21_07730 [Opitutales bacterium]